MHDVIVVGAGPAGSHVARRLAEAGHRVLVLEKKTELGGKTCTGIVGEECVRTFDTPDRVVLRRVASARIFSPSGDLLHVKRPEPQACILDRAAFDIMMAERAQSAGAKYRFDSPVKDVRIEPDRAVVTVSRHCRESTSMAGAVVIAAGFAPGLLRRLGLGSFGDCAYGAQVEMEAPGADEVEVYFGDVAPGFFGWLVPAGPSAVRVGLLSRRKPGEYLRMWLKDLTERGRIPSANAPISYGAIPLRPLPRTHGSRLLVVGDSAGHAKPTSGGGIYYGLLGAEMAADTLQGALADGDLSAQRLARYRRAWRRKLGRELTVGYWARKLYERLGDRRVDRLFGLISSRGIDEVLLSAQELSFDWHSRTIMRLLRYQVVSRTIGAIKLPFRGRIDRDGA